MNFQISSRRNFFNKKIRYSILICYFLSEDLFFID
jgi:hypothetical protein